MPNYKKMYFKLYRAHCKVLATLKKATYETEKMAIKAKDPITLPVCSKDGVEDNEDM